MATKPRTNGPYMPAKWELADAHALKALLRGDADSHQQQRAIDFIVNKIARTYDLSYRRFTPRQVRDGPTLG